MPMKRAEHDANENPTMQTKRRFLMMMALGGWESRSFIQFMNSPPTDPIIATRYVSAIGVMIR
jgi:hypothetical protein